MGVLWYILSSVFIVSLVSFAGIFTISFRKDFLNKILVFLVAFSAGTMLSISFFDLIPESYEMLGGYGFILGGIAVFFMLEGLIHWHHHHLDSCGDCVSPTVYLNLFGDGLHNFVDGLIIAATYLIN